MIQKKNFNVLVVTPFFPPFGGGIGNHVLNLTRCLTKLGNTVSIISPKQDREINPEHLEHFKKVHIISSFHLLGWPYPTLRRLIIPKDFGLKIQSVIRNGDFDIVHAHGHHYPFSWFAIKSAKKFGIPSVLTIHGMYALNPYVHGGKTKIEDLFNKYFFKKMLYNSTAVIGLTEKIISYAKVFGNPLLKYFIIPNGANVHLYKENKRKKKK